MTLRLRTLASFINIDDVVCDVGCDHAYLPIYLVKNEDFKLVYATEINKNAYNIALENIKKANLENKIKLSLTDGVKSLTDTSINTLVIAGMGAQSILNIVKNIGNLKIEKLIIQANNDLEILRKKIRKYGFYLNQEKLVYDKNEWYVIGVYTKTKKHFANYVYYYGIKDNSNKEYYKELYNKLKSIYVKISFKNWLKKINLLFRLSLLKKYL